MVECIHSSLDRLDLRESSMIVVGERCGTLTNLEELWPATFRNINVQSRVNSHQTPQNLQALDVSIRTTNFGEANKQNLQSKKAQSYTANNLGRNEYGLPTLNVQPTCQKKLKQKKYSVTPYVDPRRRSSGKSLSTRCSAVQTEPHRCHKIQSMTAVKTDQQVSTEPTKRKQAIESQSSRKVLLRRPTKKISGSRITNQVYLSPDEYQVINRHQQVERTQAYLQRIVVAFKQRAMSSSAYPAYRPYSRSNSRSSQQPSFRLLQASHSKGLKVSHHHYSQPNLHYESQAPIDAYFAQSRYAPLPVVAALQKRCHSQIVLPYC